MHIKVKIKHDPKHCRVCSDMAETCSSIPPCNTCEMKSGVWVDTVKSIFETNAIVIMDNGEVTSLPINRLVDVKISDIEKGELT